MKSLRFDEREFQDVEQKTKERRRKWARELLSSERAFYFSIQTFVWFQPQRGVGGVGGQY